MEIYKQKVEYSSISDLCWTGTGHKTQEQEFQEDVFKKHKILSCFPCSIYQVRWAKWGLFPTKADGMKKPPPLTDKAEERVSSFLLDWSLGESRTCQDAKGTKCKKPFKRFCPCHFLRVIVGTSLLPLQSGCKMLFKNVIFNWKVIPAEKFSNSYRHTFLLLPLGAHIQIILKLFFKPLNFYFILDLERAECSCSL